MDYRTPGFPSFTISQSLFKPMSIELDAEWCHPTILPSVIPFSSCTLSFVEPKSFPMSQPFASGGQSTGALASPSSEYSGLISFRIDWFDLLAVQGTLKSLLNLHSSKASVLWCLAFFMIQLSASYMTTGIITTLTIQSCWQSNVSAFYYAV